MTYYVYVLSNSTNVAVYTGVTSDLIRRVYEHRTDADPGSFSSRYRIHKLVYFEEFSDPVSAISREKQIKSWRRMRKNELVSRSNPTWANLYPALL